MSFLLHIQNTLHKGKLDADHFEVRFSPYYIKKFRFCTVRRLLPLEFVYLKCFLFKFTNYTLLLLKLVLDRIR